MNKITPFKIIVLTKKELELDNKNTEDYYEYDITQEEVLNQNINTKEYYNKNINENNKIIHSIKTNENMYNIYCNKNKFNGQLTYRLKSIKDDFILNSKIDTIMFYKNNNKYLYSKNLTYNKQLNLYFNSKNYNHRIYENNKLIKENKYRKDNKIDEINYIYNGSYNYKNKIFYRSNNKSILNQKLNNNIKDTFIQMYNGSFTYKNNLVFNKKITDNFNYNIGIKDIYNYEFNSYEKNYKNITTKDYMNLLFDGTIKFNNYIFTIKYTSKEEIIIKIKNKYNLIRIKYTKENNFDYFQNIESNIKYNKEDYIKYKI